MVIKKLLDRKKLQVVSFMALAESRRVSADRDTGLHCAIAFVRSWYIKAFVAWTPLDHARTFYSRL